MTEPVRVRKVIEANLIPDEGGSWLLDHELGGYFNSPGEAVRHGWQIVPAVGGEPAPAVAAPQGSEAILTLCSMIREHADNHRTAAIKGCVEEIEWALRQIEAKPAAPPTVAVVEPSAAVFPTDKEIEELFGDQLPRWKMNVPCSATHSSIDDLRDNLFAWMDGVKERMTESFRLAHLTLEAEAARIREKADEPSAAQRARWADVLEKSHDVLCNVTPLLQGHRNNDPFRTALEELAVLLAELRGPATSAAAPAGKQAVPDTASLMQAGWRADLWATMLCEGAVEYLITEYHTYWRPRPSAPVGERVEQPQAAPVEEQPWRTDWENAPVDGSRFDLRSVEACYHNAEAQWLKGVGRRSDFYLVGFHDVVVNRNAWLWRLKPTAGSAGNKMVACPDGVIRSADLLKRGPVDECR